MAAQYLPAADALAGWREELLSGKPPKRYPAGVGELARVEIGPGLVTLFGGAPGAGKTALTMQLVFDALRLTEDLRAVVCNVEMAPAVLLDRQFARLSGIDLSTIRQRRLGLEHKERVESALATLGPVAGRLAFIRPPFDLSNVAEAADDFGAGLLLLDYLQRIPPPGEHADRRGAVDASMAYLRQFADAGVAVVVVSAVSRGKDSRGRSSYAEGLSLASFRESSELEFGADDAFMLAPAGQGEELVVLRHLKSRHGEPMDAELCFDGRLQRFAPADAGAPKADADAKRAAAAALWRRTAPAPDDPAAGEEDE